MTERVHQATELNSTTDIRGPVAQISYQPPYPHDGQLLDQALWIAGLLQLKLDVQVELIEKEPNKFDVRLVAGDSSWMRYHGPFTASELRIYLRGFDEGFKYAFHKPL